VLHIVHRLGDGGADRTLVRLANAASHDVAHTIYSLAPLDHPSSMLSDRVHAAGGPGTQAAAVDHVRRGLRLAHPRPSVVHGWVSSASPVAAIIASVLGVPLVLRQPTNIARELEVQPSGVGMRMANLRRIFESADRVVLPSAALAACTEEVYGRLPTVVIPNAAPEAAAAWSPRPASAGRLRLAFAGRLVAQKDPLALIEACVALPRPVNWTLDVYGEGPLRADMEARAAAANASPRVRFMGYRPDWLSHAVSADAFVLPTLFEGMSNTLLEVAATGMPIITTAIAENRAVLTDGIDALLVPPGSPEDLSRAIARLAAEPALGPSLGAAAARIGVRFPLSALVRAHEELYASLC
jgi:glycosyltransferase involved in cell wall biosynthesis